MNIKMLILLTFILSCASEPKNKTLPAILADHEGPRAQYVTVTFEKGKTKLDQNSKQQIEELFKGAKFTKVRVLTWADREYPDKHHKEARAPEIILADDRGEEVENFLKKEIKRNLTVESFNMAKRPGIVEKLMKTSDFQIKDSFEKSGTTGTQTGDGSVSYTKASKAIIIIDQPNLGQEGAL